MEELTRRQAQILPTPRPSPDQALRLSLLDGPPGLPPEKRSAMPIIAGLVTVALAAAGAIFVMTRDPGEPAAKPAPPTATTTVTAPAPTPPPIQVVPVPVVAKEPAPVFVVADDPTNPKLKRQRLKTEQPKQGTHEKLVTTPGKEEPCVSPEGSPCNYTIGDDTPTRKPTTDSPRPEAPPKEP